MYKLLLLIFVLFFSYLQADEKIEIFATKIQTQNNVVSASQDVAVVYKDYYLSASKAVYNKKSGDLELFDNVRANKEGTYKVLGNYAKLNIKNKEKSFQPFYMLADDYKIWISADSADEITQKIKINSGIISSCNPNNPLWKMEFTSSEYNLDDQWLSLYNARIYIYDIPIFYIPWIAFPMDKTRRTGLLKPSLGYSSDEGIYYEQPIYIAQQDWWGLELKPQFRNKRGNGIYSKFRFSDSRVSKGEFTLGYFNENDKYAIKNKLAHNTHRGFDFKYNNSDFLKQWTGLNFEGQSGLYVDIGYMNDVDYINLASNSVFDTATATQVLSRINMFYNTDSDYFGAYFKYYQDLTKESNADTLQQIPTLHYHHYLQTLFENHLLYNIDIQSNNIQREINKKVLQTDINIPVKLHASLFDEYLNISFDTNFYMQHSAFSGTQSELTRDEYKNGYIIKSDSKVNVSSDLTKAYEKYTHVISLGSSYIFDGADKTSGFYSYNKDFCKDPLNQTSSRCEFYKITDIEKETQVYFSQFLYDEFGSEVLYHRLAQAINYAGGKTFGDLENELDYKITSNFSIYNNMFYNHKQNKLSKIYNKLSYKDYGFNVAFSHIYRDTFLPNTLSYTPYSSYVTSSIDYIYDSHYTYKMAYDYDLELEVVKRKELGFVYSKRCWDFGIRYVQNNRPVLQNTRAGGISNIPERYIYFTINLKPFMASNNNPFFAYKLDDKE